MNNVITLLIGLFLVALAISAIITGESTGFSAGSTSGHSIYYSSNPVEFSLKIVCEVVAGIWLVKKSIPAKSSCL